MRKPFSVLTVRSFWWLLSLVAVDAAAGDVDYLTEQDLIDSIPLVYGVSHFVQPVEAAPAAVTVIDRELIAALNAKSIADILTAVPGFGAIATSQLALASGYQLGGDPFARRMHVEIDGRPLSDSMLAVSIWDDLGIDIADIERVEVIRSSNLPADGGNALLGTVNIVTGSPLLAPLLRVGVEIDQDDYLRRYLNGARTMGRVDAQVWLAERERLLGRDLYQSPLGGSDGYLLRDGLATIVEFGTQPNTVQRDSLATVVDVDPQSNTVQRDRSIGGRLLWSPSALDSLELAAGFSDSTAGAGEQQARYSWQQLEWQRVLADGGHWQALGYHNLSRIRATGLMSLHTISAPLPAPVTDPPLDREPKPSREQATTALIDQSGRAERWGGELRRHWRGADGWQLSAGAALSHERAQSEFLTDSPATLERDSGRLFAAGEWRWRRDWLLSGGLAGEWAEQLSSVGAARLGANYAATANSTLRLAVAAGTRQPTLLEQRRQSVGRDPLSEEIDLITLGDPQLDIESSRLLEFGYHWRSSDGRVELDGRWYHQQLRDPILPSRVNAEVDSELGEDQFIYYQNRGDIDQRGVELQLTARQRQAWLLHITASYMDSRADDTPLAVVSEFAIDPFLEELEPYTNGLFAARWTAGATASYTVASHWRLAGQLHWQSEVPAWLATSYGGVARLNLSAQRIWPAIGGSELRLTVEGRNLGDAKVNGLEYFPARCLMVKLEMALP